MNVVSGHADTIRSGLIEFFGDAAARGRGGDGIYGRREDALAALDALVAENQQLRDVIEEAHVELDNEGVSRSSYGGPFGDIKYEDRVLNLVGRIHILASASGSGG